MRRQTSGQGQGDQKPPAKKARGHAAGAGREVRSGMDLWDPVREYFVFANIFPIREYGIFFFPIRE